jgi:hypothetical protein
VVYDCPYPRGTIAYYRWWDDENQRAIREANRQHGKSEVLRVELERIQYGHDFGRDRQCVHCGMQEKAYSVRTRIERWANRDDVACSRLVIHKA